MDMEPSMLAVLNFDNINNVKGLDLDNVKAVLNIHGKLILSTIGWAKQDFTDKYLTPNGLTLGAFITSTAIKYLADFESVRNMLSKLLATEEFPFGVNPPEDDVYGFMYYLHFNHAYHVNEDGTMRLIKERVEIERPR